MIYQIWVVGIALEVFISPYVSVLCYFLSCLYITLRILYGYIYGGDETSTCFRQGLLVVYPIYSFIIFALYCCLLYTVVKSKKKSFLLAFKVIYVTIYTYYIFSRQWKPFRQQWSYSQLASLLLMNLGKKYSTIIPPL